MLRCWFSFGKGVFRSQSKVQLKLSQQLVAFVLSLQCLREMQPDFWRQVFDSWELCHFDKCGLGHEIPPVDRLKIFCLILLLILLLPVGVKLFWLEHG